MSSGNLLLVQGPVGGKILLIFQVLDTMCDRFLPRSAAPLFSKAKKVER